MDENSKSLTDPRPLTAQYTPHTTDSHWYGSLGHRKRFVARRDVPDMLDDPRVTFGLDNVVGPIISRGKFYIDTELADVKELLIKCITRYWRNSAEETLLKAMAWGWCGSEVMYRSENGNDVFDCLKGIHPHDVEPWTTDGKLSSLKVRNVPVTGDVRLGGMKGFWNVHGREHHPWWGRSKLRGAFPAWYEIWCPDGAREMRRLFHHKYAYDGGEVHYQNIDFPQPDGTNKTMKQIVTEQEERAKNGGIRFYPFVSFDKPLVIRKPPLTVEAPQSMGDYYDKLAVEIWEGIGIPPEVLRAEFNTGAEAGRRVPLAGFYSSLQRILYRNISEFDEQVARPLMRRNFWHQYGEKIEYEIVPFPLMDQEAATDAGIGGESPEDMTGQVGQDATRQAQAGVSFSQLDSRIVVARDSGQLAGNGVAYWKGAA